MDDEQNEDTEEIIQVNIVLLHSSLIIHNFPYTFDIGSISQKEFIKILKHCKIKNILGR